jgi:hypothetical protein
VNGASAKTKFTEALCRFRFVGDTCMKLMRFDSVLGLSSISVKWVEVNSTDTIIDSANTQLPVMLCHFGFLNDQLHEAC